jgi:hypothetical protein
MGSSPTSSKPRDLPLCFGNVNTQWFTQLQAQINAYSASLSHDVPPELQAMINEAYGDIALVQSTIQSQLAFLGPLEALLTAPEADLTKIVTWISNYITSVLTPLYAPFAKLSAQVSALEDQVSATTSAIQGLASLKGWSINIPPTDPFCTL